jgi:hypothetical protein
MDIPAGIKEYRAQLGQIARWETEIGRTITASIAKWIPDMEAYFEMGVLKPLEYQVMPGMGWEAVIAGIADLEAGKAAKKIVVKVQEE